MTTVHRCDACRSEVEASDPARHEWWTHWRDGIRHACPACRPGASLTPAKPRQAGRGAAKGSKAADGRPGPLAPKSLFDAD